MQRDRDRRQSEPRGGLSLVELLVVMGIVGLLMALVLPAIQHTRSAAQMTECKNHLRQLGLAVNGYAEAFGVFPANYYGLAIVNGVAVRVDDYSAHARLLPYCGYASEYKAIDFGRNLNNLDVLGEIPEIPLLKCATDPAAVGPRGSYVFSIGSIPVPHPGLSGSGAFPATVGLSPAAIRDGLSNTVGISEKLCGSGGDFDVLRDAVLVAAPTSASDEISADYWLTTCRNQSSAVNWNRSRGFPWIAGSRMVYNHILPPNSPIIDCGQVATVPTYGIHTARSFHAGVVNAMKLDGAVATIANSIDWRVWRALGTRAGSEP